MINAAMEFSPDAICDAEYYVTNGREIISINVFEHVANEEKVLAAGQLSVNITIAQAVQLLKQLREALNHAELSNMDEAERSSNSHLPAQLTSKPVTLEDVSDKDS